MFDNRYMKDQGAAKTVKMKDGFLGQRMIVVPHGILGKCKRDPLLASLYLTDIGFFPKAKNHYVQRKKGSAQYVLIHCCKGRGQLRVNNSEYTLTPNTFFIIPPNTPHVYSASERDPWSIYWVHFTGKRAGDIHHKFLERYPTEVPTVSFLERRLNLFDNLLDILEDGFSKSYMEYVNISLWQMLNSFLYQNFFVELGRTKNQETLISSIIGHMRSSTDRTLKIDDLAAHFNYSASHFFSMFKRETGFSPIHYFNDLKVQKACQYLSFTSWSIKEIGYALGFNDPLYFSRLFKKTMGMSPLKYRDNYKNR